MDVQQPLKSTAFSIMHRGKHSRFGLGGVSDVSKAEESKAKFMLTIKLLEPW